jgi:hypothetical protein
MVLCYVKGARKVNGLFRLESMPSGGAPPQWFPKVASGASGLSHLASLASAEESTLPAGLSRKSLNTSQNFIRVGDGGFRVASPVKKPDARKLPR